MPLPWVWEEEETQPKSSQYQAKSLVLSLGKQTLKTSNFMAKGFPFTCGSGGHTRGRTMLHSDGATAAGDRGGESKTPQLLSCPQPFQYIQAWEIIVNVKGIKKASACVCVCESCQVNTAADLPDSSKIDYPPQRSL